MRNSVKKRCNSVAVRQTRYVVNFDRESFLISLLRMNENLLPDPGHDHEQAGGEIVGDQVVGHVPALEISM